MSKAVVFKQNKQEVSCTVILPLKLVFSDRPFLYVGGSRQQFLKGFFAVQPNLILL